MCLRARSILFAGEKGKDYGKLGGRGNKKTLEANWPQGFTEEKGKDVATSPQPITEEKGSFFFYQANVTVTFNKF
jgi:hypothetical protein